MIKITRLRESAIMPRLGSDGAAGYDLLTDHEFWIEPSERKLIGVGIATEFDSGAVGLIRPRSGLAYKIGIDVMAGVIDSDYRGEIKVLLENRGGNPVKFRIGEAIAQILFIPVLHCVVESTGRASETERGANGFGSTDR